MNWFEVHDGDPRLFGLYLRHYSSEKARGPNRDRNRWGKNWRRFIGNGEHMALITTCGRAGFAWRRQELRDDDQMGVECSFFRNEGAGKSTELIREAMELAWARWPNTRLFTFVNPTKIRSTNPGYCFMLAGWERLPTPTRRGLRVLVMGPWG